MQAVHSQLATSTQVRVLDAIDELLVQAGDSLSPAIARHLREGAERVGQARFNLVVLGEFKRGKSTLINSLLGRDVLPTGVVPLTSAITVVRYGSSERLIVRYEDGREDQHELSELARFVTERENPQNRLGVDLTTVETPAELLAGGVQLVDTPGIGSVHAHNTTVAWEFVPRIDAALCVLNADQPFTQTEREFFLVAAERVSRLLVAVNKIDHLAREERPLALEFIKDVSGQLPASAEVEFFAVSARDGEGIPKLRERIRQLAQDEAGTLVISSVTRLAAGAAEGASQALGFEAHAIELPLDELRRRALLFRARVDELGEARSQADDLLQAGVRRLLDQRVNEPLIAFAREHADELSSDLSGRAAALGRLPARELGPALDVWIDEAIREHFGELVQRLEASLAEEVRELQRGFARRIEAILVEVQDAADEAFGSRAGGLLPEVDLSEPSAFTFKLADVAQMLDNVVAFGRRTMPGELGRRMVTRDAQERLSAMADRHAGRLRSALVERVRDAVRGYQRQLSDSVEEEIGAIQATVERVSHQLAAGEHEVTQRRAELNRRAGRLQSLREELSAISGAPDGAPEISAPVEISEPPGQDQPRCVADGGIAIGEQRLEHGAVLVEDL